MLRGNEAHAQQLERSLCSELERGKKKPKHRNEESMNLNRPSAAKMKFKKRKERIRDYCWNIFILAPVLVL